MHVNSPASADENKLKCEKVRFFWKMSEITEDELLTIFQNMRILKV